MDFHPVASIFPLMGDEEFKALSDDIRANGLLEPIWTHEGKIVDGRNRYRACVETGTPPRFRAWSGQGSLVSFVVSLNLNRRHLTSSQRAVVALEVEKVLSEEAKANMSAGGGDKRSQEAKASGFERIQNPIRAAEQAAAITGTNPHYVSDAKQLAQKAPDLFEKVAAGETTIPKAKKEMKKREREAERTRVPSDLPQVSERFRLIHGDVSALATEIGPETVDAIITDPPYPREYLPVYESLARLAAHCLKPGGSLVCMVGQSYLPEVLNLMTPHIEYHWTVSYLTPGGQSAQLWQRKVNTFWKPVLWFVKGKYEGAWVGDVAKSATNDNDKRFHDWGQSESGMADLIERFTRPGETILDPFMGGGTTGYVALALNRLFIGADIDEAALSVVAHRLLEVAA